MKEKDLKLRMIVFNLKIKDVVLRLCSTSFIVDGAIWEPQTSINKMQESLVNEENIDLIIPGIMGINGKRVVLHLVTDEMGEVHAIVTNYKCDSGCCNDAFYSYEEIKKSSAFGLRFFFEDGEYIWNAGVFQKIGEYTEEQLDLILNTL